MSGDTSPWRQAIESKRDVIKKRNEDVAPAVVTGLTFVPVIGPIVAVVYSLFDQYSQAKDSGDEERAEELEDEMEDKISEIESKVSQISQYYADPNQVQEARRYYNQVADALSQLTSNYNIAMRRLDELAAHKDDYIHGVQKKNMNKAYDDQKKNSLAMEDEIASQNKKLNRADLMQQTMSDLSMTPVNSENEEKVKNIASDLGIRLSKTEE